LVRGGIIPQMAPNEKLQQNRLVRLDYNPRRDAVLSSQMARTATRCYRHKYSNPKPRSEFKTE
jgi:hypothetical protein